MTAEYYKFMNEIKARDGDTCTYQIASDCEGTGDSLDHVIPVSSGGLTRRDNLVNSCSKCQFDKGAALDPRYLWKAFDYLKSIGEDISWHTMEAERRSIYKQIEITCSACGDTFYPTHVNQRWCSGRCRQRAYKARMTPLETRDIIDI